MDCSELNDLEYKEERKEASHQTVKKNITLKLKSQPIVQLKSSSGSSSSIGNQENKSNSQQQQQQSPNQQHLLTVQSAPSLTSLARNNDDKQQQPSIKPVLQSERRLSTSVNSPESPLKKLKHSHSSIEDEIFDIGDEPLSKSLPINTPPPPATATAHVKKETFSKIEKLNWNYNINIIGKKLNDQNVFCCELCLMPILIYGRMMPCKHVFCIKCAHENAEKCAKSSCRLPIERIEEATHGQIYICTYGKSTVNPNLMENQLQQPSKISCARSYMSLRDLNAHIMHRHEQMNEFNMYDDQLPPPQSLPPTNQQQYQPNRQQSTFIAIMSQQQQQQQQQQNEHLSYINNHHPQELMQQQQQQQPPPLLQQLPSTPTQLLPTPNRPPFDFALQQQQQQQSVMNQPYQSYY